MDIRDELNAIRTVLMQQRNVIENLQWISRDRPIFSTGLEIDDDKRWRETMQVLEKNIGAVHELLGYTEQVQRSVENLLNFKQMHISTWEARMRRVRAEGAERSENVRESTEGHTSSWGTNHSI
jgi:hypothetical protein